MKRDIAFPPWWWGPFGELSEQLPITRLIADGALDAELAAWLWLLIEAGASTIVCAGPSGVGKSTLLTSLLPFLNAERKPYFVRGRYERFDAIDPPAAGTHALLINEISAHLPIYLWGPGLARAHELAHQGAQLMATAHADTPGELVHQLAGFPNDLAEGDLACWHLVIFLDAWIANRAVFREIRAVETFLIGADRRLTTRTLAGRAQRRASLRLDHAAMSLLVARLGIGDRAAEDVIRRAALLRAG